MTAEILIFLLIGVPTIGLILLAFSLFSAVNKNYSSNNDPDETEEFDETEEYDGDLFGNKFD